MYGKMDNAPLRQSDHLHIQVDLRPTTARHFDKSEQLVRTQTPLRERNLVKVDVWK